MRLFVAVPIPIDLARVGSAALPDHALLRRVAPELMHVTLAFLGATPETRLADVATAVTDAATGHRAFTATVERIGRFPQSGAPRVVWLGIGSGAAELNALAERTRLSLSSRGITFDGKPFRPHVTLARVREDADRDAARQLARALDAVTSPTVTFSVAQVVLFESVVSSKGPRYTARATVPLRDDI